MISLNNDEGGGGDLTAPDGSQKPNENNPPIDPKSKKGRSGRHKFTCASNRGEQCDCRAIHKSSAAVPPNGSKVADSQAKETLAAIEAGKTKTLQTKLSEAEDALNREKQLRAKSEKVINATRKVPTPGNPKKSLWQTIKDALRDPLDL